MNFESPNHIYGHQQDCCSNLHMSFREPYLAQHTPEQQQLRPWDRLGAPRHNLRASLQLPENTHPHLKCPERLCWCQQASQELSWPGKEVTGRAKERQMTNRCLPAIPPALWLRGQSTAICTVYLLPEAKNAEYWVSQILAGFCPRASHLYNLTSTTAIVLLLLDLSLPFPHDYLQKLLPPIQSTLGALLFTNYFLFFQMSLSWGKAWAKKNEDSS